MNLKLKTIYKCLCLSGVCVVFTFGEKYDKVANGSETITIKDKVMTFTKGIQIKSKPLKCHNRNGLGRGTDYIVFEDSSKSPSILKNTLGVYTDAECKKQDSVNLAIVNKNGFLFDRKWQVEGIKTLVLSGDGQANVHLEYIDKNFFKNATTNGLVKFVVQDAKDVSTIKFRNIVSSKHTPEENKGRVEIIYADCKSVNVVKWSFNWTLFASETEMEKCYTPGDYSIRPDKKVNLPSIATTPASAATFTHPVVSGSIPTVSGVHGSGLTAPVVPVAPPTHPVAPAAIPTTSPAPGSIPTVSGVHGSGLTASGVPVATSAPKTGSTSTAKTGSTPTPPVIPGSTPTSPVVHGSTPTSPVVHGSQNIESSSTVGSSFFTALNTSNISKELNTLSAHDDGLSTSKNDEMIENLDNKLGLPTNLSSLSVDLTSLKTSIQDSDEFLAFVDLDSSYFSEDISKKISSLSTKDENFERE